MHELMALNEIVETDQHAMPKIEDILDALQGSKYFSVLDLKEGYFQILLKEEDCHKTAFTINQKKYEFKRMVMGFKNSPAFFQQIMELELREWIGNGCLVYLDDIVIYAKNKETHDELFIKILTKLKEKNLRVNPQKVQIRKPQIRLLEMIVDGTTVTMPEDMKDKIFAFQEPKSKKDLQRF